MDRSEPSPYEPMPGDDLMLPQDAHRPHTDSTRPIWKWATHVLIGLWLGTLGGALFDRPWNNPVHWVNVVVLFGVILLYLLICCLSSARWFDALLPVVLVMTAFIVSFNAVYCTMHGVYDIDFIQTPIMLMTVYLLVCALLYGLTRLGRRLMSRHHTST